MSARTHQNLLPFAYSGKRTKANENGTENGLKRKIPPIRVCLEYEIDWDWGMRRGGEIIEEETQRRKQILRPSLSGMRQLLLPQRRGCKFSLRYGAVYPARCPHFLLVSALRIGMRQSSKLWRTR